MRMRTFRECLFLVALFFTHTVFPYCAERKCFRQTFSGTFKRASSSASCCSLCPYRRKGKGRFPFLCMAYIASKMVRPNCNVPREATWLPTKRNANEKKHHSRLLAWQEPAYEKVHVPSIESGGMSTENRGLQSAWGLAERLLLARGWGVDAAPAYCRSLPPALRK